MSQSTISNSQFVFVVGDRFEGFAQGHEEVFRYADANEGIHRLLERGSKPLTVVLGQGLHPEQARALHHELSRPELSGRVEVRNTTDACAPASLALTHRRAEHNVLLTDPQRVRTDCFEASFRADDRCAEMSDHVTGQHIQGMVLVEAARQMMLAVTEKYLIGESLRGNLYVVLNRVDAEFYRFTFPLQVGLLYQVVQREDDARGSSSFEVNVGFIQAARLTSEVRIRYSTFGASQMNRIEAMKAAEALSVARTEEQVATQLPA